MRIVTLLFAATLLFCAACSDTTVRSTAGAALDVHGFPHDIVFIGVDVPKADLHLTQDVAAAEDVESATDATDAVSVEDLEIAGEDDAGGDVVVDDTSVADVAPDDAGDAASAPDAGDDTAGPASNFEHLCDPCATAGDCNTASGNVNLCIPDGGNGSFCGVACTPGSPGTCPAGYECSDITDGKSGAVLHQCMTTAPSCSCSASAVQQGMETSCNHKTSFGTCLGVRSCKSGTLSACSAPWPAQETCNGLDDDCNGLTDDFPSSSTCLQQNAFGVCKGNVTGCDGNKSICNAKVPAAEVCNQQDDNCDGQTDEGLCGDGDACTVDVCDAGGGPCTYVPMTVADCDDANACTTDSCVAATGCVHVPVAGACEDDGNVCTLDQCDAGKCAHPLVADASACDDGNPCTTGDGCVQGQCIGNLLDCSGVENACNTSSCATGSCQAVPKVGGKCDDGDACTTADACQNGACIGDAMDCSSLTDACNAGTCSAGACVKKPAANGTGCDDGSQCTTGDVCSGGVCAGSPFPDAYEPNNSQPGAVISNKTDCQGNATLGAAISPQGDVDWYTFSATDETFCTFAPNVSLSGMAADYDLCVFFACQNGKSSSSAVSCKNGFKTAGGPNGSSGCCSTNAGIAPESAKIDAACTLLSSGDDSGTVWVRVQAKTSAQLCGGYVLTWGAAN